MPPAIVNQRTFGFASLVVGADNKRLAVPYIHEFTARSWRNHAIPQKRRKLVAISRIGGRTSSSGGQSESDRISAGPAVRAAVWRGLPLPAGRVDCAPYRRRAVRARLPARPAY